MTSEFRLNKDSRRSPHFLIGSILGALVTLSVVWFLIDPVYEMDTLLRIVVLVGGVVVGGRLGVFFRNRMKNSEGDK